jgi:hypothetical protein
MASGLARAPVDALGEAQGLDTCFPQHVRAVRPPVRFYENGWAYRSKSLGVSLSFSSRADLIRASFAG